MGNSEGELLFFVFLVTFYLPLLSVTRPSPALVFHAKFCLSISLPLSLICLSVFLSRPRVPKGPLVCLTRLWLQDLCIQCVIIVPTLSSESLSDWLTDWLLTKAHWSLCVLPGLFIHLYFIGSYPSSFSFFPVPLADWTFFVVFFLSFMFFSRPSLIVSPLAPASAFLCVSPPPLASPALIFSKCLYVIS